jgi:hypothetical protein
MSIEKYNDLIGNLTHDLPACNIVPQPTTLPRSLIFSRLLVIRQYVCNLIDLREIGWDDVDWIHLSQGREKWRALVNMVRNLRVQ